MEPGSVLGRQEEPCLMHSAEPCLLFHWASLLALNQHLHPSRCSLALSQLRSDALFSLAEPNAFLLRLTRAFFLSIVAFPSGYPNFNRSGAGIQIEL